MIKQLHEHTQKLEQCLKKFDLVVSEISNLKVQNENTVDKATHAQLENKFIAIENLNIRLSNLEKNLEQANSKINADHDLLQKSSSQDFLKKTQVDAIFQKINDYLISITPQIIEEIAAKYLNTNEKQEEKHTFTEEKIEQLKVTVDSMTLRIGTLEESLQILNNITDDSSRSSKLEHLSKQMLNLEADSAHIKLTQEIQENALNDLSEKINKLVSWINIETMGQDIDKLNNEQILLKEKFGVLEKLLVQLSSKMILSEDLDFRLKPISNEIFKIHEAINNKEVNRITDDTLIKVKKDNDKLKADFIWGIQEMRQRIDAFLYDIQFKLLEEDKKRYEKVIQIELGYQKQARISNAIVIEINKIRRLLPLNPQNSNNLEKSLTEQRK